MRLHRLLPVVLAAAATLAGPIGRALGDEAKPPAYADPSPLTGKPVSDPSLDARLRTVDAAGRRASDVARAEAVAPLASGDASPAPVHGGRGGLGLEARPNYALDRLKSAAMRTVGNTLEPRLETVWTVAAEAWSDTAAPSNRVVVTQPKPGPQYFSGTFRPATIDDAPAVLRVYRSIDRGVVPPPAAGAATPPPSPPASSPFDLVKGVLVRIDDVRLAAALSSPETSLPDADLDEVEREVLGAASEAEAAGLLEARAKRWLASAAPGAAASKDEAPLRSVSLRDLLTKAAAWRERWAERPPELRRVGGLTRIAGVTLGDGDVRLLGREEAGVEPLLLDELAEGFRAAWRDDVAPACTLDPSPKDVSGPQYAHVFGVRRDSSFAKTMLEADYAMKKLLFGAHDERLEVPGWRTLADLYLESPDSATNVARFWLYPVQPRPGDVLLARDRRSAYFRSGVQVLSEDMVAGENGFVGTGRSSGADGAAARSFSEHYEEIAAKRPVFRRLAALFDVVLAARILRVLAPEEALLRDICALPEDPALVPTSYAGVVVQHAQLGLTITGGCDVSVRARRRAWLATAGDGPATPRSLVDAAARAAEEAYTLGSSALAAGDLDRAVVLADQALDGEPTFAEAYALRASARSLQGDHAAALRDAEAAALLEPGEPEFEAVRRRVLLESGAPGALDGLAAATRAVLLRTYVNAAAAAIADPESSAARSTVSAAERAVTVDPDSAIAWTLAGWSRLAEENATGAEEAANRATLLAPDDPEVRTLRAMLRLQRGDLEGARTDLDHGLAHGGSADLHGWRATQRLLAGDLPGAVKDVEDGLRIAPRSQVLASAARFAQAAGSAPLEDVRRSIQDLLRLPLRVDVEVSSAFAAAEEGRLVEATRHTARAVEILDALGAPKDMARTRIEVQLLALLPAAGAAEGVLDSVRPRAEELAAELLARHPDFPSIRLSVAIARHHLGEREAAFEALQEGIRLLDRGPRGAGGDPLASEMLPGDPARAAGVLRVIQLAVLLAADPTGGDIRMAGVLEDLLRRLDGSPAREALLGIRTIFAELAKDARGERPGLEDVRRHLAALDASGLTSSDLLETLVVTFFGALDVGLEAVVGDAPHVETAARVALRLRPQGEFSPVARALIPQLRSKICQDVFARLSREVEAALEGPAPLDRAKAVRDAWAKPLEVARAVDEPALLLRVRDAYERRVGAEGAASLAARVRQLERVANVADEGPKKERLVADLAKAREALARATSGADAAIRDRVLEAYRSSRTLTQMRTVERVLGALAAEHRAEAAHYAVPEEAADLGRHLSLDTALGRNRKERR